MGMVPLTKQLHSGIKLGNTIYYFLYPGAVTPFVIVPTDDFSHTPINHLGQARIKYAGVAVPDHIPGHEWIRALRQYTPHRAFRRPLHGFINFGF